MGSRGGKEAGAEVKVFKVRELAPQSVIDNNPVWKAHLEATKDIPEATPNDLEWADAIIFSAPTRFGVMASQMEAVSRYYRSALGTGQDCKQSGERHVICPKSPWRSEATVLSIYTVMCHWGAIIAAPGFTDPAVFEAGGNPYGTTVTVDEDGKMVEDVKAAVKHQAKRTVTVARWLKKGREG